METTPLITFLSDFGWQGGYVAACEAVIASVAPHARVLHIGHDIALGDLRAGATALARVAPLGPIGVHLAVVDPGVGTGRRPIVVETRRGDLLVGPDNGLLMLSAGALEGIVTAWRLDPLKVRTAAGLAPEMLSHTFHGRDLFAPAAALLAAARRADSLGDEIPPVDLVRLPLPYYAVEPDVIHAEVVEVDRFGNVALCVGPESLPGHPKVVAVAVEDEPDPRWMARRVHTFGDLEPGELGLLQDSWGQAGLTLNGASAAELLGARVGSVVQLRLVEPTA